MPSPKTACWCLCLIQCCCCPGLVDFILVLGIRPYIDDDDDDGGGDAGGAGG